MFDQNGSSRRIIDELCERAELGLPITMKLGSLKIIKRLDRIDAGLSIVPESRFWRKWHPVPWARIEDQIQALNLSKRNWTTIVLVLIDLCSLYGGFY